MHKTLTHIICTRKIDSNNKNRALESSIIIDDYDFLDISYLCSDEMISYIASPNLKFVFTSTHAVESVYQCIQKNKLTTSSIYCYAIKGRTANQAKEYGFTIINTGLDGQHLAEVIINNNEKSVIHFTTKDTRKELIIALEKASIQYTSIIVYEKTIREITLSNPFDGILFFSPSQIDGFLKSNTLNASVPAFCIGATTQSHLQNYHHENIHVAKSAEEAVLIDLVINYFNNNNTL